MKQNIVCLSLLFSVGSVGAASTVADVTGGELSGLALLQKREAGLEIGYTPATDQTDKDTETDIDYRPPQSPAKNIDYPYTVEKGTSGFEYRLTSYGNPSDPQGQFNPSDPYNRISGPLKNQEDKPTSCYATPCGSKSNSRRTSLTEEANPDDCMFDMDEEQSNN